MKREQLFKKILLIGLAIFGVFFAQVTLPTTFELRPRFSLLIFIIAIVSYFLIIDFKTSQKLARNAFFLITIFGTVIAFARPPQYALDEETHLKNTIGLSDSFLFKYSEEELTDYDAVFLHDGLRNAPNYKGNDYWVSIEHTDSQVAGEPVGFDNPAYLPGVLGWNLGELLSKKIIVSYYLGRIGTVLAYAVLVYLAIRLSWGYKEGLYLLGTLPAAIYVTAGFHYDYLYYGISLLLLAFLTNIFSGQQKLTLKRAVIMQGLAFLLVFAKFPYVLLAMLPIFIPKEHCPDKRVKPFVIVNFLLIMVLAVVYSGIINVFKVSTFVSGSSPGMMYFIHHPLPLIRTLVSAPFAVVENFIARPLQYITVESGLLVFFSTVLFFTMYIIVALKTRIRLNSLFKWATAVIILIIALLTIYAITGDARVYSKGDVLVGGVQGRYYFFPMAILPLYLSDWIHRTFDFPMLSAENEQRLTSVFQYASTFLIILTISVALYTQI